MNPDVAELVRLAESAARQAGGLIVAGRAGRPGVAGTKTSPTDVVTAMDQAVENLLRSTLARARPGDGLLGEEQGFTPGESGLTWVLDPIDGTVNYVYGLPAYAVSVAVVRGDPTGVGTWEPIAGCVHAPATGQTWTAGEGLGARLDGDTLRLGPPPGLDRALVATGFGYQAECRAAQARVLNTVLPQVRDIRRLGACSVDLCLVATGSLDAYYERGIHTWDMAAATLVVTEAGGTVRGLDGAPPSEAMVVAAAEPLCGRLAALLAEAGAGQDT